MKPLTLHLALLLCLLGNAYGQTKADILTTSTVMLGTDSVKFMPDKLVSVDTSGSEVKTYIEPKIEFSKWTNPTTGIPEETLTLEIPSNVGYTDKTVDSITGEVVMRNDKEGFYFKKHDDRILKFGLILYEKPKTNTWTFEIKGADELNFCYQKPWENYKDIDNDEIEKTDDPDMGHTRKINVQGSYAVYHKTKKHNQYLTGKFGHIYRPRVVDTNGKFLCWADIKIENNQYILTVAQSVLDTAKYPILFNDDFGQTSAGGSEAGANNDLTTYWTSFPGGTVTELHVFGKNTHSTTDGEAKLYVYTDEGDGTPYPNTPISGLLGTVALPHNVTVPADYTVDIEDTSVSAQNLWLAGSVAPLGYGRIRYDNSTGKVSHDDYCVYASTPQNPYPDGDADIDRTYSFYLVYTPSGATPRRRIIIISHDLHKNSTHSDYRLADCLFIRRKVFA